MTAALCPSSVSSVHSVVQQNPRCAWCHKPYVQDDGHNSLQDIYLHGAHNRRPLWWPTCICHPLACTISIEVKP
jgi:hypothetical protein